MSGLFGRPKTRTLPTVRERFPRNALLAPNNPPGSARDPLGPAGGRQESVLRSYTPNPAERAQNALTSLLTAIGSSPATARRAAGTAVDFSPVGMVRDVRNAGWQTYRGVRDEDGGKTLGGILGAAFAALPIPGPVKKPVSGAADTLGDILGAALRGPNLGPSAGPLVRKMDTTTSSASTAAKRLRREGMEATGDSEMARNMVAALQVRKARLSNRPISAPTPAQVQARRAKELEERRRAGRFSGAPIWPELNAARRAEIEGAAKFDGERADELARLAVLEAVTRKARQRGYTIRHTSRNGRADSRYLVAPNGREVRLSDHALPDTPQRADLRERRDARWAGEVIVGRNWDRLSIDDWLNEVDTIAGLR